MPENAVPVKIDQWPNVLNWNTPIGRVAYLLHMIFATVLIGIGMSMVDPVTGTLTMLGVAISFLSVVLSFSSTVRRLIDMGKNPWLCLLNFIPIVSLVMFIWLLFARGQLALGDQYTGITYKQ